MFRTFLFFIIFAFSNTCNMNIFLVDDTSLENTIKYIFNSKTTLKSTIAFKVLSLNQSNNNIKYLKSINIDPQDFFGYSLSLSEDSKTLAAGAYREDSGDINNPSDNSKQNSGAVYIFQKNQVWTNTIYIKSPIMDTEDFFGYSISLSKDGNTLAVGAYGEDSGDINNPSDNSKQNSGAVYIFQKNMTTNSWTNSIAYIKPPVIDSQDSFGFNLKLNKDGTTLVVTSSGEDSGDTNNPNDNSKQNSGAVYIFQKNMTTNSWTNSITYIKPPIIDSQDSFGVSLSLNQSGNILAVGASGEDGGDKNNPSDNSKQNSGAVYIFQKNMTTNSWTNSITYIKPSVIDSQDSFGVSLSLNQSGNILAVGASGEDSAKASIPTSNTTPNSGAVYIFQKESTVWKQNSILKSHFIIPYLQFGSKVRISGDGKIVAASAPTESGDGLGINSVTKTQSKTNSGAVFTFENKTPNDSKSNWKAKNYIKSPNPDVSDSFGSSIDLNKNETLVIGAQGEDSIDLKDMKNNRANDSGAVYIY